jgi:hypothetical protein
MLGALIQTAVDYGTNANTQASLATQYCRSRSTLFEGPATAVLAATSSSSICSRKKLRSWPPCSSTRPHSRAPSRTDGAGQEGRGVSGGRLTAFRCAWRAAARH